MADDICVGAITGAYGVKGELRLKSFCATPEDIGQYGPLKGDNGQTYQLKSLKPIKGGFSARTDKVSSKEEADALKGVRLYAPREALPSLPDDEYYHTDLIGLEVLDTGGAILGKITSIQNHGAGDIVEFRLTTNNKAILAPFTLEVFPTIDIASGRVILDAPDGLLE